MIMFNTNESECRNTFNSIYDYLSKELEGHIVMMTRKKEELYQEYLKKRNHRDNKSTSSTNAQYEIKEKWKYLINKRMNMLV